MSNYLVNSAVAILPMLYDKNEEIQLYALEVLLNIVNTQWHEIADEVVVIEKLCEDENFKNAKLAALLASQVYYHLGDYSNSLHYALGAGDLFDINSSTEYVQTIVSKCIDDYASIMSSNYNEPEKATPVDKRLEDIVNRMVYGCIECKKFRQAIGIALETRRSDLFIDTVAHSDDIKDSLRYTFQICVALSDSKKWSDEILKRIVDLNLALKKPDYFCVVQCLIYLEEAQNVAKIMYSLVENSADDEEIIIAFQIAFDVYENASQQFLKDVIEELNKNASLPNDVSNEPLTETSTANEGAPVTNVQECGEKSENLTLLLAIMSGEITIDMHMQFLIKNNHADILILKQIKDHVRNSICHNATIIANGFMYCGTTCDHFLRDNLDWLGRATNWAKFTVTASLGVIHKGHEKEALRLMSAYLPKESSGSLPYAEGGGLYALGLIYANHGESITEYLLKQLRETTSDVVKHGGCLGLGLAAMGTASLNAFETLKVLMGENDATIGEAATIAIGLVMLGTASAELLWELANFAEDTQHEKIIRGISIALALILYNEREEAETFIELLYKHKEPLLRRSAMYCTAMAWVGTGHNPAVKRLLHFAVSDVNDDVRRAAVESLGFVMFRNPEQFPSVISLLSESYNPHVRYGSAMALGIACAGTGLKEALNILEPLFNDAVNFVRQGAVISAALICMQHTEFTCPKVKSVRELIMKIVSDKHEDVMVKFGAILAQGIIDAGGRNVSISLMTRSGLTNSTAVVGLLLFLQFWFWFPLSHMLSLAFTPTCLIGLNKKLQMPEMAFLSNSPPSHFSYPTPLEEKKGEKREKVEAAVLSTTLKQKRRDAERKAQKAQEAADQGQKSEGKEPIRSDHEKKSNKKESEKASPVKKVDDKDGKEKEPNYSILKNPAVVMRAQQSVISMMKDSRYTPVKSINNCGIIMMMDSRPGEPETLVEFAKASGPVKEEELPEAPVPEPFQWNEDS